MNDDSVKDIPIEYRQHPPSVLDFIQFRAACGWGTISQNAASLALSNSLFNITAYRDNILVGFGRVVGDGVLNFYIQDLIVLDEYRGSGIGSSILEQLLEHIRINKHSDPCSVCLMSAIGKESFYESFGFIRRPNERFGSGMILDIE